MKAASVMVTMLRPERVCVIGLGGLGCPVSLALAQAGVRHLTLVDPDVVDLTNLHRQPWHHTADVGRPKVDSAAQKLRAAFPQITVEAQQTAVTTLNAKSVFEAHTLVIDGTDGVDTKFLLSDVAVRTQTPLIYGGVLRFEGLAMRIEPRGPCLRCLFEVPPVDVPTCAQAGVLGSMAGLVGGLQAWLGFTPNERAGEAWLHVLDGAAPTTRRVRVKQRSDCVECSQVPR